MDNDSLMKPIHTAASMKHDTVKSIQFLALTRGADTVLPTL